MREACGHMLKICINEPFSAKRAVRVNKKGVGLKIIQDSPPPPSAVSEASTEAIAFLLCIGPRT